MIKRLQILRRNSGKDFSYLNEINKQILSLNKYLEKRNSTIIEQNKALTSQLVEKASMYRDLRLQYEELKEEYEELKEKYEKAKLSYRKNAHEMWYDRKMLQKSNRNQARLLRERANQIESLEKENKQLRKQLIRLHWSDYDTH